jgi:hypothetical protein
MTSGLLTGGDKTGNLIILTPPFQRGARGDFTFKGGLGGILLSKGYEREFN